MRKNRYYLQCNNSYLFSDIIRPHFSVITKHTIKRMLHRVRAVPRQAYYETKALLQLTVDIPPQCHTLTQCHPALSSVLDHPCCWRVGNIAVIFAPDRSEEKYWIWLKSFVSAFTPGRPPWSAMFVGIEADAWPLGRAVVVNTKPCRLAFLYNYCEVRLLLIKMAATVNLFQYFNN